MAFLKHATVIAVMAGASVMSAAGMASAAADGNGDNSVGMGGGLVPVNTLNSVNVAPNFGCLLDRVPDLSAQGLVGVVPVGAGLNHLLEHPNLNVLSNSNVSTDTYDNSCTSNQPSSQAGNNSHGSVGAGSSASSHQTAAGAGSQNGGTGKVAGGLLGTTGLLGTSGLSL